jgi:hypothetical protein
MSEVPGSVSAGQTESEAPSGSREGTERAADSRERPGESVGSHSNRNSTAELGGMILAFAFGAAGFALRILWIPALVAMAVVFGLILADRRTSRSSKGVVPEIVASVAKEAREIYQAASGTSGEEDTSKAAEKPDDPGDGSPDADAAESEAFNPSSGEPVSTNGHSSMSDPESSVRVDSVERPSVGGKADETGSMETENADSDGSSSDEAPVSADELTEESINPLPVRFILSADHMAARNPLLRPVRRRLLGMATSLSHTIVKLAATPPDRSDR